MTDAKATYDEWDIIFHELCSRKIDWLCGNKKTATNSYKSAHCVPKSHTVDMKVWLDFKKEPK